MNLLLDTNILLNIFRSGDFKGLMQFINPDNAVIYISVASEAEIRSIALKNKWGTRRYDILNNFLDEIPSSAHNE